MEIVDLYDKDHRSTGETSPRDTVPPEGRYMQVVHMCVFNAKGELLVQRRSPEKDRYPGIWDLSAGGFAKAGETAQEAALRETAEEVGLECRPQDVSFVLSVPFRWIFDDFFRVTADLPIEAFTILESEVTELAWVGKDALLMMAADGLFVDYDPQILSDIFDHSGSTT